MAALLLVMGACTTTGDDGAAPIMPQATQAVVAADKARLASLFETPVLAPSPLDYLSAPFITAPEDLVGKDDETLYRLMGKPAQVRHESPAQVWQYQGDTCVLDFFLYREAGPFVVAYAQARKKDLRRITPEGCLDQVMGKHKRPLFEG